MDDLISRQAAILLADKLKDDLPDDEQIAGAVMAHNEGILEYQTALSLMPPEQRWIPVSERLPEKAGKYLVTVQNGNVYAGTFDAFSGRFQCAAVAWMELPEPYREGGE